MDLVSGFWFSLIPILSINLCRFVNSWSSVYAIVDITSDPFTKILLIIGVIIAYVVISILFALIGFGWDNFDTPPEGLRPRFFGDSR